MATLGGTTVPDGLRIADFAVHATAAGTFLYAATAAEGILGFGLGSGAAPVALGIAAYAPGADVFGPPRLDLLVQGGSAWLFPGGRFPAELTGIGLQADGHFGASATFSDGPGGDFRARDMGVLDLAGTTRIFAAGASPSGIAAWSVAPAASELIPGPGFADTAATYLADVGVITAAALPGAALVLAGSAAEHGVTALRVAADGSLSHLGSIGANEGFGLAVPSALEVATLGGQSFLIVADAGTSALSVLRIDDAALVPTDQVMDTLSTRMQGVTALSVLTIGERCYVAAGGGDDGISVFQLLPDGRLFLATTIADEAGLALADVSALRLVEVGGEVQLFVASGSENGLSQFRLTPGPVGMTVMGGNVAENIAGGVQDDHILGGGGNDVLSGGAGRDILVDGSGADTLTGGQGADVFVLYADGQIDRITDFDIAQDRLDLSDWLLLNSPVQLLIEPTVTGAILRYGNEVLEIVTHDGSSLLPGQFTTANVLNLPRPAVEHIYRQRLDIATPGADSIVGTVFGDPIRGLAGNDTLDGGDGDDTLTGGPGSDRLNGGAGSDFADYATAAARVTVDLVTVANNQGEALGDRFSSVENLRGSAFDDDLRGNKFANLIEGGDGADGLTGREGNDTLRGGAGNDNLVGGSGADLLDGGAGLDRVVYSDATSGLRIDLADPATNTGIAAGDVFIGIEAVRATNFNDHVLGDGGNNTLDGGTGDDQIFGGEGNDWVVGRAGVDLLDGGGGNDILLGGPGADLFVGGAGIDRAHYGDSALGLVADLLIPANNTGLAAGDSYAGIENLQGSLGNDTLRGDHGNNMISGARGDDVIDGRGGNDFLIGLDGADVLAGGAGDDTLFGGAGADRFVFGTASGTDRVMDFQIGVDQLRFSPDLAAVAGMDAATLVATYGRMTTAGATFDFGNGDMLIVRNVADPAALIASIIIS